MFARIAGRVALQQPDSLLGQLDPQIKPAQGIDHLSGRHLPFCKKRVLVNLQLNRARAVNGHLRRVGRVRPGVRFKMHTESGQLLLWVGFVCAAATEEHYRERRQQIDIESVLASYHSIAHEIGMPSDCKEL